MIESGAGQAAGFEDAEFSEKGASIAADRSQVFSTADVIAQVRAFGANPDNGGADLDLIRDGQVVVGLCDPLLARDANRALAERGATLFSLEMMPRTPAGTPQSWARISTGDNAK